MQNAADFLWVPLLADAHALGSHWIYDPDLLAKQWPDGPRALEAPSSPYHPKGKPAGDFTHYGVQTLILAESLEEGGGEFSVDAFRESWTRFWKSESAASYYLDGATKGTLANLAEGRPEPSPSSDISGASRIGPILAFYANRSLAERIEAARVQTAMTHGDSRVVDTAEFLVRAVDAISGGASIAVALEAAAAAEYGALPAREWLALAKEEAASPGSAGLSVACGVAGAFPLTLTLALRFSDEPFEGVVANAALGGDNAARAQPLAMLFTAVHGGDWIPPEWREAALYRERIAAVAKAV